MGLSLLSLNRFRNSFALPLVASLASTLSSIYLRQFSIYSLWKGSKDVEVIYVWPRISIVFHACQNSINARCHKHYSLHTFGTVLNERPKCEYTAPIPNAFAHRRKEIRIFFGIFREMFDLFCEHYTMDKYLQRRRVTVTTHFLCILFIKTAHTFVQIFVAQMRNQCRFAVVVRKASRVIVWVFRKLINIQKINLAQFRLIFQCICIRVTLLCIDHSKACSKASANNCRTSNDS